MKTKYVTILLSILMLIALAACGGGGDGDTTTPTDDGAQEQATGEEAPADDATGETGGDAAGGETAAAGDPAAGETAYNTSCVACHGPEGSGVQGLGLPLAASEFVNSQSDEELLAFIKEGRPASHPDNVTGLDMPPKGGNPALTDEQILNIVAYLRTLQ